MSSAAFDHFEWLGPELRRAGAVVSAADALRDARVIAVFVGDGVLGACATAAAALERVRAGVPRGAGGDGGMHIPMGGLEVVLVALDEDAASAARTGVFVRARARWRCPVDLALGAAA